MSEFEDASPELSGFEASLARLLPAASRIDRDRLMFRLGQQSPLTSRRSRVWPAATLLLAVVTGSLGWRALTDDRPRVVYIERTKPAAEPALPRPASPAGPADEQRWSPDPLYRAQLAELRRLQFDSPQLRLGGFLLSTARLATGAEESAPPPDRVPATAPPTLRLGDRQLWHQWLEEGKDST